MVLNNRYRQYEQKCASPLDSSFKEGDRGGLNAGMNEVEQEEEDEDEEEKN